MSGINSLPICDHGRCSSILDAVAARDDRISGTMADAIAEALEATLAELGVDHSAPAVRAALARHLARVGGVADPGTVA